MPDIINTLIQALISKIEIREKKINSNSKVIFLQLF
jgi:hypothetical protein